MKRIQLLICLFVILTTGCTKTDSNEEKDLNGLRILIANEGQFTQGTASLTAIYKDGSVVNDVFRTANNRPIGDVAQAIEHYNDNFYVTLNNSKKIEVMNDITFKSVSTITLPDQTIPYFMCILGKDSMAVTDIGSKSRLMIIDLNTNTLKRVIEKIGSGKKMIYTNNKLFVTGSSLRVFDSGKLNLNDMRTIKKTDASNISSAGNSKIVKDKNGKLWVLSAKELICIDPAKEAVIKAITFNGVSVGSWDGCLDIDESGQNLYFTGKVNNVQGILKYNINDSEAPTSLLFETTGVKVIYNMALSHNETIIVNDVEYGSLARGKVHEYSLKGEELHLYEAGIFPQDIYCVK